MTAHSISNCEKLPSAEAFGLRQSSGALLSHARKVKSGRGLCTLQAFPIPSGLEMRARCIVTHHASRITPHSQFPLDLRGLNPLTPPATFHTLGCIKRLAFSRNTKWRLFR